MFRDVHPTVNFAKLEENVLRFWQEGEIFAKSLALRKGAPYYVFYEGPPTANGKPGIHHVLTRVFKDLFLRYQAMKGKLVLRKGGWNTHGLPVELAVEKELGIAGRGKRAIEEFGVAAFNAKCKESVFRYVEEWARLSDRIAFWGDMAHPYVTLSNEYIESVWWILKQLWDRKLLYQRFKVVPYCPRCGTPLSDHEVHWPGALRETSDPSLYVRFPLKDQPGTYFLAWTTTPWTLPANVALAVNPDVEYNVVESKSGEQERLIVARERLGQALEGEYEVVGRLKGRDLAGRRYQPLYTFLPVEQDAWYVVAADFVSTDEGTGIVHQAAAFAAADLQVAQAHHLPILQTVKPDGTFVDAVTPWRGLFVKDADPLISEDLRQRGLLYRAERRRHAYPHCWRCDTPLLYYARTTWYIETTRVKDRLLANNEKIRWHPEHVINGRFGTWLEHNTDWALGRERYWGTPLPVWRCEACGEMICVGSVEELRQRMADGRWQVASSGPHPFDLHRPYVDRIALTCVACGGTMRRVPELIDAWFDCGAMPMAQWHMPFENQREFEDQFPADFICEGVDQTRGWFYSLHAISTLLFDRPCFKNGLALGLILDEKGEKMSKTRGNAADPWDVLNAHGADALRWYLYTASPPGQERRFSTGLVGRSLRRFLRTLWNTYSFFVTYAKLDGWTPAGERGQIRSQATGNALDRWILSELHALIARVDERLASYDVMGAARPIEAFVDDLSNWYVRRSRRRFSKSQADEDKQSAYATLYEVLTTLAKLLAPFTPFIAEEVYQNLVRGVEGEARESVHLCDFPKADSARIDPQLMADTRLARKLSRLGLAARNQANIKVRQPLAEAVVALRTPEETEALARVSDQVRDELNVKAVRVAPDLAAVTQPQVRPDLAKLGARLGPLLPTVREAFSVVDTVAVAAAVRAGEPVVLDVDGQPVVMQPDEVILTLQAKAGWSLAEEGGYVVAVATRLTDDLRHEGLARELVRHVQKLRKLAGLQIADTIVAYVAGGPETADVLGAFADYIKNETWSREIVRGAAPEGATTESFKLAGEALTVGVKRAAG